MNLKLTYFTKAVIVSVVIFIFIMLGSSDLRNPYPFYLLSLGIVLLVNVSFYLLSRRSEKRKK